MAKQQLTNYSNKQAIREVLGCFLQQPSLIKDFKVTQSDFPETFHKIIFASINNLYKNGAETIDSVAIDEYVSNYETQYQIFLKNEGIDFIDKVEEMALITNIKYYYEQLKKFTLLRSYIEAGQDISDFFDPNETDPVTIENQREKLDTFTTMDIIKYYKEKQLKVSAPFILGENRDSKKAGVGGKEQKEKWKKDTAWGIGYSSAYLTTVLHGLRKRRFTVKSAGTGGGKCIIGNSLIYTDKGLLKIEDIPNFYEVSNERVQANIVSYDLDSKEKSILPTSHWYNMGLSDTIKIITRKGYEIEGTPEHPIVVGNKNGETFFKKLRDITKEDMPIISLNNCLFGNKNIDEDIAYALGVLIGDGYLNYENNINKRRSISYSNGNSDIYEKVNETLVKKLNFSVNTSIRTSAKRGIETCHEIGNMNSIYNMETTYGICMNIAKYKNVPKAILNGNKTTVKKFLQGLFDTDGGMCETDFQWSTASETMSKEVQILLLNFGILSKRRLKIVNETNYYCIDICDYPMLNKFYQEIGFNYHKEKYNELKKSISKEVYNSNIDFFYGIDNVKYIHDILKSNIKSYKYSSKSNENYINNGCRFYNGKLSTIKRVSRARICKAIDNIIIEDENFNQSKNQANNMYFDEITTIEKSQNIVYDFTVPNTHSFVSNGFISHNTRTAISDIGYSCAPSFYDKKTDSWIKNPNGVNNGALYIGTEMELLEEIDPILWAYIADVPQEHIEFNAYEEGEEERVDIAIDMLEHQANIWFEYIPNYDSNMLEEIIEEHKIKHDITHVFFDYIHTTVELISEYSSQSKTKMVTREDQVLAGLSNKLKSICRKYDVSLDTSTQVTGEFKNEANRDQTIVRGAKSIIDKADNALIAMPPSEKELKKIEPILRSSFNQMIPNMIYSVYKNRGGKWSKVKIWLYIDFSTMRTYDLFVTDYDYKINTDKVKGLHKTYINIEDVEIVNSEPTYTSINNPIIPNDITEDLIY